MRNLIATLVFIGFSVVTFAQTKSELADKQFDLKAYKQAITSYRKILVTSPKDVKALTRLADAYFYTNNMKEALATYKRAVQLPDGDPKALLRYGKAFMRSGDYSNAEKIFKAYAEIDKKVGTHYENYARMAAKTAILPPFYQVKKEYLNTSESDFSTTFFGDKVVYSSARSDIKRKLNMKDGENWAGRSYNQLFITARDKKGFLQKPKLLNNDLVFNYNEGPIAYNGNSDKIVAITKNEFINGHTLEANLKGKMTLLSANYLLSGTWGKAKAMGLNDGAYSSGFPSFSPDGKTLFFSSNRPGGEGGYDIYASTYDGDKWSAPLNLGVPVNTSGDEITPFMDGNTLFFSSNWLPGLGGFDLYRAEQEGVSLDGWDKVFHMGTGVNSSYDDFGFVYDNAKNIGYFSSNRRGIKSSEDIFRITKVSDKIEIIVLNASDNLPLKGATIDFSECGETILKTNKKGKSVFQALAGLKCDATIKKPGFKPQKLKVVSSGSKQSKTFVVKLIQAGEEYIGKVVDNDDNQSMEQVLITATPRKGGAIKTFSDANGEFVLPLKKEEEYIVVYSKAGFSDVVKDISTGDGKTRTILGIQPMLNAYSGVVLSEKGPGTKKVSAKAKKEAEAKAAEIAKKKAVADAEAAKAVTEKAKKEKTTNEAVLAAVAAAEKAKKKANEAAAAAKELIEKLEAAEAKKNKLNLTKKYAVQVAAYVNDGKSINMSKYKKLFDEGNVYSRPSGKHVKIRVGVYDTKAQANKHLKSIKKSGFRQAFVISEYLEPTKEEESLILEKAKKEVLVEKTAKPTKPKKKAKKHAAKKASRQYYVQLAAYTNTKHFPRAKVEKLGKVVNTKGKKYTTMYVTGFDSLEDAIDARNKAIKIGFKHPYIVYKRKGRFVRMKF